MSSTRADRGIECVGSRRKRGPKSSTCQIKVLALLAWSSDALCQVPNWTPRDRWSTLPGQGTPAPQTMPSGQRMKDPG